MTNQDTFQITRGGLNLTQVQPPKKLGSLWVYVLRSLRIYSD